MFYGVKGMIKNEWEKKRKVLTDYNETATHYDCRYNKEQKAKYSTALGKCDLNQEKMLLDIGCGTGLFIKIISKKVLHIVGIDFSLTMLKIARLRCKPFNNVTLICCDADYLPFKEESFDSIFSFTLLQNLPDPYKVLGEITRIAKNLSIVVITNMKKNRSYLEVFKMISEFDMEIIESINLNSLEDNIFICTTK